jgi:hypothetical protein
MWLGWLALCLQDADSVARAFQKNSELKNYAVKISLSIEGGGENAVDLLFDGGYDSAEGILIQGEYLTVPMGLYRKDGKTAVIDPTDKKWKKPEQVQQKPGSRQLPGRNFKIPHEEFKGFETKLKDVKKGDSDRLFTAELTEAGAKSLLPGGGMGGVKAYGDVRLKIDPAGHLEEILIMLYAEGSAGAKDYRITTIRTVTFSRLGGYQPAVPDEARRALD